MPRQRRSAPSRPAVAPKRPSAPTQQQPSRPSSTVAYPPAAGQKAGPPTQNGQQQGSGLFGQMVRQFPKFLYPKGPFRQRPKTCSWMGSEFEALHSLQLNQGLTSTLS